MLDLLGDAQGLHAPFGFQDAFVRTSRAAVGVGLHVRRIFATEHTAGQRAVRHHTEAIILRGGDLLGFSLAVDDVVQRLADHRPVDTELVGHANHLGDAPATIV
ncbi:hypothetical protein D3C76_970970 [compost metagenome]